MCKTNTQDAKPTGDIVKTKNKPEDVQAKSKTTSPAEQQIELRMKTHAEPQATPANGHLSLSLRHLQSTHCVTRSPQQGNCCRNLAGAGRIGSCVATETECDSTLQWEQDMFSKDDGTGPPLHFVFTAPADGQGVALPELVSSTLPTGQELTKGTRQEMETQDGCVRTGTIAGDGLEDSKSRNNSHEGDWILVTSRQKVKKREEEKKARPCMVCKNKPPTKPSPMRAMAPLKQVMKLLNPSVPGSEKQPQARTKRHCPSGAPPGSFMPLHQLVSVPFVHQQMPRRVRPDRRVKYYPAGTSCYSTRRAIGAT